LALDKRENFFQLPIRAETLQTVTGGHEVTVDVFSDKACTHLVYSDLRCITVDGSPIDEAVSRRHGAGEARAPRGREPSLGGGAAEERGSRAHKAIRREASSLASGTRHA
jgi:hypothetical protein